MRSLALPARVLLAATVVAVGAASAFGQYYVPLRYDLRYGRPVFVPGREPGRVTGGYYGYYDQPVTDPYSFQSVQARNYYVTGNVRGGKSFKGSVPYSAIGSQLSTGLPTTALSDFRRDSFSIEDLGSGLQYGARVPYVPESAAVTNAASAGLRFEVPQAYMHQGRTAPATPEGDVTTWQLETPEFVPPAETAPRPTQPGEEVLNPETLTLTPEGWSALRATFGTPAMEEGARQEEAGAGQTTGERPERRPDEGPFAQTFRLELPRGPGYSPENPPGVYGMGSGQEGPAAQPTPVPSFAEEGEEMLPAGAQEVLRTMPTPDQSMLQSQYGRTMAQGRRAFQDADYAAAARFYRDAAVLRPDEKAPQFGLVYAYLGAGVYHRAALAIERLFENHPEWVKEVPDLRSVFPEEDALDRITQGIREQLDLAPTERRLNLVLGYVYYSVGARDLARTYLEKAAESVQHLETPSKLLLRQIGGAPAEAAPAG